MPRPRPCFEITARDPETRGRAGVVTTAHGTVRTPAFVPLATKGTVKGLEPRDVRELGYDMVLGNTFHLMTTPGKQLVKDFGGLHEFMRWDGPIVTDSGGFQVFSMGHGTIADEVKGRSSQGAGRDGKTLGITEKGATFRSYLDGSKQFLSPEESMDVQAHLHSDIALVFDECTPFHVSKNYTDKSTQRSHRWLERCLDWHEEHGPSDQLVYGIVQGGVYEDLRTDSARVIAQSRCDGIAIGGSLGGDKPQMYQVVDWATAVLPEDRPRHLLGIGDVDDLLRGVELGIDTFDCAMPTRLARHGVALVPNPAKRWRVDLTGSPFRGDTGPVMEGCPCPCCREGFTRGYLAYLHRSKEQTGPRLLTLHNLAYTARLMADLRAALASGELTERIAALRAGDAPRVFTAPDGTPYPGAPPQGAAVAAA
ncbi:MAG: tRNA guanosine(34) transglycosylase Tgt [Solirubrobacteraceae bacterium]|nr:tRNA guanosine(34) transglycosylase Tgt [Solirubrobacteraceae bacterium]